ncbi:hypothetical protein LDENG_00253940 [Lucifuga dentata]|nr:hypothetical protein LDENG_00253940 [Lucifuga dentata]
MSKKSKKRKSKKLSSSSSSEEDDEKVRRRPSFLSSSVDAKITTGHSHSSKKDVTRRRKTPERKQHVSSHHRCTTKKKKEESSSHIIKDDSQSSRMIRKALYRLARKQETDQTSVCKPEERTVSKSVSSTVHEEKHSQKEKADVSGKHTVVSVYKTVEVGPSLSIRKCLEHLKSNLKTKKSEHTGAKTSCSTTTEQSSTSAKQATSASSSNALKHSYSKPGNVTSASHKTAKSSPPQQEVPQEAPTLPIKFKIQKKPQLKSAWNYDNSGISTKRNLKSDAKILQSGVSGRNTKQKSVQPVPRHAHFKPSLQFDGQDQQLPSSDQQPALFSTNKAHNHDQMHVVEEIKLARSEKTLEVNVMQSYGELTSMVIDPPDEGTSSTLCKQSLQRDLIVILDTNILLSHLDYVKKIHSHGLGALGFPVVLIPWVVLQELDSLKMKKRLDGSVAHMASPAISHIYNCLTRQEPRFWGQSMQQAAQSSSECRYGLNAENNDDRVLQCCLQYQNLYPECALILCTNDKNLCSKALLSGVTAFSKSDLEKEAGRSNNGLRSLQSPWSPMLLHSSSQIPAPARSKRCTSTQCYNTEEITCLPVGQIENDKWLSKGINENERRRELSRCVSELEECLREVLSDILEVEMKAVYDDLWLEVVYIKPPWTLGNVLQCFKKHWIAVFGFLVPRKNQGSILNLIDFFSSDKTVECSTTLEALQEVKELLKAFEKRSSRVSGALSILDNIFHRLQPPPQPQEESASCDVVMNDDEEEETKSTQVTHQEVWTLFENIWCNINQMRLTVFKALHFDPQTMQSAQSVGGPPPPQDALACLHKLSSMMSQLLQAFSSVLSSSAGLLEIQALLCFIHSSEIVTVDSRLTAQDLLDCFSQEEYRKKLQIGGNQLMEVKSALDRCIEAISQHIYTTYF